MRKCVKVILKEVDCVDAMYDILKSKVPMGNFEGVAEEFDSGTIGLFVYGDKELVDQFVDAIGEIVVNKQIFHKNNISFIVEPFFRQEDYRGVFRFIKKKRNSEG